jgi:LysM repeat protein
VDICEYNIEKDNVRSKIMDNNMNQRNRNNGNIYCDRCFDRCRGTLHVIESGDTLYNLGRKYQVTISDIMRSNPYVNVYNLQLGEELCIPILGWQPNIDLEEMPMEGIPMERMPIGEYPMEEMPMEGMQNTQEFSEEEPLNIVFERLGITMEQFLKCIYESENENNKPSR